MTNEPATDGRHLILVAGTARSGSTALDLLLSDALDAISCGEIHAVFRPYREHHLHPHCRCGLKNCEYWAALDPLRPAHAHAALMAAHGRRVIVDSSKNLVWISDSVRWAREMGVRPAIVLTWKSPADLAHSWWKRYGDRGVAGALNDFVRYHSRLLSLDSPFVAVRNRDVVRDGAAVTGRIGGLLGLEAPTPSGDPFGPTRHLLFGSGGVKQARAVEADDRAAAFEAAWDRAPEHLVSRADALAAQFEERDVHGVAEVPAAAIRRRFRLWHLRGRVATARHRRRLMAGRVDRA